MATPSPSMRDLARRLSAGSPSGGDANFDAALLALHRLSASITKFAGADGSASLLRRALKLATVEAPLLRDARIGAGGQLEGLEQLATNAAGMEATIAIIAHLLDLLVTFIGEPLTLKLVRDAFTDGSWDHQNDGQSGKEAVR